MTLLRHHKAPALRGFVFLAISTCPPFLVTQHSRRSLIPLLLLTAALASTALAYWVGLHGPFVLDDQNNLAVIQRWLQGNASLTSVLLDGRSGMFGRPLSMGSLAFSAWLGGYQPFAFKLGNLATHLACGLVIFALVRRLAGLDPILQRYAQWTALAIAVLWLLHPLNASTVLYAVQRMAQMSALFLLLGMWFYIATRSRLAIQPSFNTNFALFAGTLLLLIAGLLSKENGVLLPPLCLAIELAYFSKSPRPSGVRWFFGIFLWLPIALGVAVLALMPDRLLGAYIQRDFDLTQRVLSQTRALSDYLRLIVAPDPPRMGVYTDDFLPSTGLLSPPSTLLAIIALIVISWLAWRLRERVPALLAGWGIFLAGHALESTILPLELYFEHRNYLPMLGILYALAGLAGAAGLYLQRKGLRPARIGIVLTIALAIMFAIGTQGRARVWSSEESLAISAMENHPLSTRANLLLVATALKHGNGGLAERSLQRLSTSPQPRVRATSHLIRLYFSCLLRRDADPRDLQVAMALLPPRVSQGELELFSLLYANTPHGCGSVTDGAIADAIVGILERMTLRSDLQADRWHLRYIASEFYLRAGDSKNARKQAQLAWQPTSDPAVASILIQIQLADGNVAAAQTTLDEAWARLRHPEAADIKGYNSLRQQIDQARASQEPAAAQGSDTNRRMR